MTISTGQIIIKSFSSCSFNKVIDLPHSQARKYLLTRLTSIHSLNRILFEIAFFSSPVTERPNHSEVSAFGIATFEVSQKPIDTLRVLTHSPLETTLSNLPGT